MPPASPTRRLCQWCFMRWTPDMFPFWNYDQCALCFSLESVPRTRYGRRRAKRLGLT